MRPDVVATRVWIDCEFNEFGGDLISMALVAESGSEWYAALRCPNPGPWVMEHVMPVLGENTVVFGKAEFTRSLQRWLRQFPAIHVIADWPEDIAHFCEALIVGPGMRIDTPLLTLEIRRDLDGIPSSLPHNALADARAIRDSQLALERTSKAMRSSSARK